jgi:TrmH family RNA methyltransferase
MITSASNKSIKNVQALLSKAKERKKQGVFVVEGPKMSFEAPYDWVNAVYMSHFLMMTGLRKRRSVSLTKQK